MKTLLKITVLLLLLDFSTSAQKVAFPLKFSNNKRYLVDKNDTTFLIKVYSAWGMFQAMSEQDEISFLDSLKKEGFNTVLVSIQGWWYEVRDPKNSPEKMRMYGEFPGKRYQNTPNIMWVAGATTTPKAYRT